jgi:hypothetical protein
MWVRCPAHVPIPGPHRHGVGEQAAVRVRAHWRGLFSYFGGNMGITT